MQPERPRNHDPSARRKLNVAESPGVRKYLWIGVACLCPALSLAHPLPARAQVREETARRGVRAGVRIGLSFGWDQAREDLLAPITWSGPGVGIRLSWRGQDRAVGHAFDFLLPFSLYENRFGHRGFGLGIEVDYGYSIALFEMKELGGLSVGGRIRWDLHDGYYQSWDEEHAYWLSTLSLGPRLLWASSGGRNLRLTVDMPLLAGVARPPRHRLNKTDPLTKVSFHLFDMQRHMRWTAIPGLTAVRAGLSLPIRRESAFMVAYEIDYVSYGEPDRVVTLSHRFSVTRLVGR